MLKVKVENLIEIFENLSVEDFKEGNGVYGIKIGCRGMVEDVMFVGESYSVRSKEELIKIGYDIFREDGYEGEVMDYLNEFCDSGVIDWYDGVEGLYEILGEEDCIEYFDVVM